MMDSETFFASYFARGWNGQKSGKRLKDLPSLIMELRLDGWVYLCDFLESCSGQVRVQKAELTALKKRIEELEKGAQ